MNNNNIRIFADLDTLSTAAARRWAELAGQALASRGQFHVALSGGSTPRSLFERLVSADFIGQVDWQHVHIYFGDERCVPPNHPDSNFRMAHEALLSHVAIPATQIHRMKAELPNAHEAAAEYQQVLTAQLPRSPAGTPRFDLVLLGLGPDGHIASLFPDTPILQERQRLTAAVYVDQLQAWRISVTFPMINNASNILLMATGETKAEPLRRVFANDTHTPLLPVQMIQPQGRMEWYLDESAACYVPESLRA